MYALKPLWSYLIVGVRSGLGQEGLTLPLGLPLVSVERCARQHWIMNDHRNRLCVRRRKWRVNIIVLL